MLDFAFEICPNGPHTHTYPPAHHFVHAPGRGFETSSNKGFGGAKPCARDTVFQGFRSCVSFCVVLCRFVSFCVAGPPLPAPPAFAWPGLVLLALCRFCIVLCRFVSPAWNGLALAGPAMVWVVCCQKIGKIDEPQAGQASSIKLEPRRDDYKRLKEKRDGTRGAPRECTGRCRNRHV